MYVFCQFPLAVYGYLLCAITSFYNIKSANTVVVLELSCIRNLVTRSVVWSQIKIILQAMESIFIFCNKQIWDVIQRCDSKAFMHDLCMNYKFCQSLGKDIIFLVQKFSFFRPN